MYSGGEKRPGMMAKCIFALIAIVGIATIAIGIYAVQREPEPLRGSQVLPSQVAEQTGQLPRPAPSTP